MKVLVSQKEVRFLLEVALVSEKLPRAVENIEY